MTFSRDDLKKYESQTQKQVDDKVNPFRGATPAQAATPAAVAAVAAGQVDATPGGAPAAAVATPDPLVDDAPVVDEDGTLGDPTASGEGTSDAQADPSTATADPSGEPDPNEDLTATATPEEDAANVQVPKKGSAAERIVEVLDLAEGYKIYGKAKEEQVKELQAELARLRPKTAPAPAPAVEEKDEPMPDMSDPDVSFDNDKYREKMAKWVKAQGRIEARREMRAASESQTQDTLMAGLQTKIDAFSKVHPDFKEKVSENQILHDNQLHVLAGRAVAKSEHAAQMLYEFGNNTAEAVRVARLPPDEQLLYVGRMIEKFEARKPAPKGAPQAVAQTAAKKSITKAPPPPVPTRAAGRAVSRDPLDPNMGMEEFARQHRATKESGRAQNRKMRGLSD